MQREYGRRIREFYRVLETGDIDDGMSPRELCVLVWELSDASSFKRTVGSGWTTSELIMARLANDFRAAHTDEGASNDELVPPNRREVVEDETTVSPDQIERMLDGDMTVYEELELAA